MADPARASTPPGSSAPTVSPHRASDLPGPRGFPLLGVAPKIVQERFHLQLEAWYTEYGGPFTFKLGPKRFVTFGGAEEARDVLKRRPGQFRRGRHLAAIIEELGGRGLFTAEGENWRRQRKLTAPGFNQSQLRRFYPTLERITQRLHGVWEQAAAEDGSWDFRGDFERFTTDVTTALAFGLDVNSLEGGGHLFQNDIEQLFPGIARRMVAAVPLWRVFKLPKERALDAVGDRLRTKLEGIIAEVRTRLEADPELGPDSAETLLEAMIVAELTDEDDERFGAGEVFGNVLTLLLAGEDTTAHTLAWVTHALVSHPEVQAKLQAELDAVLGDAPGLGGFEDSKRLPYLNAVIQEALRIRSVAPIMFYESDEPTQVGDVQIEPGEVVVLLTRHFAVQDENFSDGQQFLPERWLRTEPANVARCPVHQHKAMMPFGKGPRICPGRGLSFLEMHAALACLCRNFELEAIGDPSLVRERFAFTMSPEGFEVRLKPRR